MMTNKFIRILKEIALLGALDKEITLSSKQLSEIIGSSQQSASRYLIEMEKEGYIDRKLGVRKQRIKITDRGRKLLEKEYMDYKMIFSRRNFIKMEGEIISGLGEGRYYTSIDGYVEQFIEKLSFKPAPGTLNVKISERYIEDLKDLREMEGIEIEGFSREDRSFGGVKCFHAEINGVKAVAVIPKRTHHQDILEFIAPYRLRDRLNLKDGDCVNIIVYLGERK